METDWKPVLRQVSTLRALLNQIMGRNTRESVRFGGFTRDLWADTPGSGSDGRECAVR